MKMPCRITDEQIYNPWDMSEEDPLLTRTLNQVTINELMGEELNVWLAKNKEFGYILEIETEDGNNIKESCIHPYAVESFAHFCRSFLSSYERINHEEI